MDIRRTNCRRVKYMAFCTTLCVRKCYGEVDTNTRRKPRSDRSNQWEVSMSLQDSVSR